MATETTEKFAARRKLILHDSLSFIALIAITIALFAVTLLLFRSFDVHRAVLARRWSDRGLAAFQANNPQQAITAYRTALSYNPGERDYEMKLAQALGSAGQTEEAYTYFLGLWELRPGDGFINLQLARLAATKRDAPAAINYYRASIYGTWEGDAIDRRRAGRLELARYLIKHHDLTAARTELLIAGGNAPADTQLDLTLAQLLNESGATTDALIYYQKVLKLDPKNLAALSAAARLTFNLGDYQAAHRLLERAVHEDSKNIADDALLEQSQSLLQLSTADSLPNAERVRRILAEQITAKQRLADCTTASLTSQLQPLSNLIARWESESPTRKALLQDHDLQDATIRLINDTELETSQHCSAATGDNALLLILARSARSAPAEEVSHP